MSKVGVAELGDLSTPVTALVGYLDRHAPEKSASLRRRFPRAAVVLAPGRQLGRHDHAPPPEDLMAFIELARETLITAEVQIEIDTAMLRKRLRMAARVRLIGALVATLSAAGLIGALIAEARTLAFSSAGVSFVSSVSTLIAQHVEAPIFGEGSGPQALFTALVGLKQQLRTHLQEAELAARGALGSEAALALVRQANKLVAELDGIELKLGR